MMRAQIGPLTALSEATATAVGAGVVLGSVSVGIVGLLLGWAVQQVELRALAGGYVGGAVGAVLALVDVILR
jgi:hypothetical protein